MLIAGWDAALGGEGENWKASSVPSGKTGKLLDARLQIN
jgi:hypothetical protein